MSLKTILACLTTKEHAPAVLRAAVPLASQHGAHLVGLHTLQAVNVHPGVSVHLTPDMFKALSSDQREEADAIRSIFDDHTKNQDFVSEYRVVQAHSHRASDDMIESARAADLVIMPRGDPDVDRHDQKRAQGDVIRQSGRPVIVVPNDFDGPTIGSNIVVGWSDTREAARAAHDMLPLTSDCARITLLRVRKSTSDEMMDADLLDLSTALARHGHKVEVRHTDTAGTGIADVLLKTAFETGADLIVTGAFGHSNAYDFVIGATTSALLRSANSPVLFSK